MLGAWQTTHSTSRGADMLQEHGSTQAGVTRDLAQGASAHGRMGQEETSQEYR